jgi:hypothetical protein
MHWDGNSGSWCEWDKTGRRRHFGYFGGGELETTDLGSGIGMHSSVCPYFDGFRSLGVGDLLARGGLSSPQSETEWIDLFTGPLHTHHPAERGVRAELSSASAEPYLPTG